MTTNLLLFAAFVASMLFMSFNYKKRKKRIIFFGDSITEQGVKPGGYISILKDFIRAEDAEEKYELIGAGIGGNKVNDLYLRMDEDVLAKGPDVVVIYAGVNDAWHKRWLGTATSPETFAVHYNALVNKLLAAGIKVIVCTPAVIGEKPNNLNELDEELNNYCAAIRNIALANNLLLVDLRKAFQQYNLLHNTENREAHILTTDTVHLNDKGNQLTAEEIWKIIKELK